MDTVISLHKMLKNQKDLLHLRKAIIHNDSILLRAFIDMNKETSLVKQFLEQERFDGYTAFQIICLNENSEIAEMLLDCGCDVNEKGKYGWTALHISALSDCIDIVMLLLNSSADPLSKDAYGFLPVDLAHDIDVKELLINAMERKGENNLARMYRRVTEMKSLEGRDSLDGSSDEGLTVYTGNLERHMNFKDNFKLKNILECERRSDINKGFKRTLNIIPEITVQPHDFDKNFKVKPCAVRGTSRCGRVGRLHKTLGKNSSSKSEVNRIGILYF